VSDCAFFDRTSTLSIVVALTIDLNTALGALNRSSGGADVICRLVSLVVLLGVDGVTHFIGSAFNPGDG